MVLVPSKHVCKFSFLSFSLEKTIQKALLGRGMFFDLGVLTKINKVAQMLYWDNSAPYNSSIYQTAFTLSGFTLIGCLVMSPTLSLFMSIATEHSPKLTITSGHNSIPTFHKLVSEMKPLHDYHGCHRGYIKT